MAAASDDILLAHPPVGAPKLERLFALPRGIRLTVALDSLAALDGPGGRGRGCPPRGRRARGARPRHAPRRRRRRSGGRAPVPALPRAGRRRVARDHVLSRPHPGARLHAAGRRGAGGRGAAAGAARAGRCRSRPGSRERRLHARGVFVPPVRGVTEIRPGTYIFNDRITALTGACGWDDCAYSVLATVVSTAVPGQAVVDAGSKALFREEVRGPDAVGFGALLDRPDVVVSGMSEEHGILDVSAMDWRPRVGDRVRIVPNHVCVSVNLHPTVHGVRGERIERSWPVAARGWEP
jgi:D-serine deaminase-like pyridoxal phosphate-dependent protein